MTFTAIYERVEDGWWMASCPEIPGAITQGETLDEARYMLRDAIEELAAARREKALQRIQSREAGTAVPSDEIIREPLEI